MEDGILNGGLYTAVLDTINRSKLKNVNVIPFGYDDCFVTHGDIEDLYKRYGTDIENIVANIVKYIQ